MKYILVEFPDSQELMDKPWLDECYLATDYHIGSSYFVPEERVKELEVVHQLCPKCNTFVQFEGDKCPCCELPSNPSCLSL